MTIKGCDYWNGCRGRGRGPGRGTMAWPAEQEYGPLEDVYLQPAVLSPGRKQGPRRRGNRRVSGRWQGVPHRARPHIAS